MRILLVDDSRAVAAVLGARLNAIGHEVVLAENGLVALDAFRQSTPDLVLMDMEMPVMDGFAAVQHIRKLEAERAGAWTPIIFLTGSERSEHLVTAIDAGADAFIPKMAPPAVLAAKMKAMARIAALRAELTQANLKLEALANQDGLTGLFNRRYLDLRLEHIWNEALRRGDSLGFLMLDVDCFKKYNDRYGHLAGDDCLRAVATAMAVVVDRLQVGRVIQSGFAARYGGEEFAVVLPLVSWPELTQVADALLVAVRGMAMIHEGNSGWGVVTLSLGAAWLPRAEGDLPAFIRQADARLYRAKQKGRNRGELE